MRSRHKHGTSNPANKDLDSMRNDVRKGTKDSIYLGKPHPSIPAIMGHYAG